MSVKHKNLKWGIFKSQTVENEFERYILENQADLKAFKKVFPHIKMLGMEKNLSNSLNEGYIILLTDDHIMTGMPTYCFESQLAEPHPNSVYRVRLGEQLTK